MESRLIFESDKTYQLNVEWLKEHTSDSEWKYLNSENLDQQIIFKIINEFITTENLFLVINREKSNEIHKSNFMEEFINLYGKIDFKIWDKNFVNVIEFNKEVYRQGINTTRKH
ncbi:hypothetical protein [Flavobacterium sp.]|uniref:hypothetical protein n=1 Tax=Flavobacterium sp. TaxID=239 RepID=UPI0025C4E76A|nr:hypothetical protein [Flavobacterium sp.]MBA4155184.1 hypothetical protein [Flavobacterium sp.]